MINKQIESSLNTAVADWVANGGVIKTLPRGQCVTFRSPCFDKSKAEMAALAKKHKRNTFVYWCDKHGICQHKTKDLICVRCTKVRVKS